MSVLTKRSTIYFDSKIHRVLRIKSAETEKSISDIVNNALKIMFGEDQLDLEAFEKRKDEPLVSFNNVLKELKRDGKI